MGVKRYVPWLLPLSIVVAIRVFSSFPDAVETYYSNGFYPISSRLMRFLVGWIPFSIGDLVYLGLGIALVWGIVKFVRKLFLRRLTGNSLWQLLKAMLYGALWVYIVFNLSWGLNYDRPDISRTMGLPMRAYDTADLSGLLQKIAVRLNELDSAATLHRDALRKKRVLFAGAVAAYDSLAAQDERLAYKSSSVKPSLFSYLGNYLGFSGYYNPFTGEAQVNTTVPLFVQPFTTCHEIGHQLGYARENEANFAGFLAARVSPDPVVRYSLYFDLYLYAASELYARDSAAAVPIRESLRPGVRQDLRELKTFYRKYENPLEPTIRSLYGNYLKANAQPKGLRDYDEVIARVMAYYRKFGTF